MKKESEKQNKNNKTNKRVDKVVNEYITIDIFCAKITMFKIH